ncbi:hypothetical protein [Achromobacter xylosoxidans]|uniref:hypothetical protein n=1 Tax=Alcaligenes xylosoxydans xylosoxydans TaxID=85698 RepID=UPI000B48EB07|nr:hypothetical protein [Achromobacter xylosoxidans]
MQETPVKFNPFTGRYASVRGRSARLWRDMLPSLTWLYNPWTGAARHPADVESDPTGLLLVAPGEEIQPHQGNNHG